MGLTIHYRLKARGTADNARSLLAQLRQRALDLPFMEVGDILDLSGPAADFDECPHDDPNRWLLVQAGQYLDDPNDSHVSYRLNPSRVIAFSTWPGEGCEEANFGLCQYPRYLPVERHGHRRNIPTNLPGWSWRSFCKTQYASDPDCGGADNFLRCHLWWSRCSTMPSRWASWRKSATRVDIGRTATWKRLPVKSASGMSLSPPRSGTCWTAFGNKVLAAITGFPNFEHLEAKGRSCRPCPAHRRLVTFGLNIEEQENMSCRIEKVRTRLTRQTWTEALSRLWALEEGGGHETLDVVDDAGEVGHACIFLDSAGKMVRPRRDARPAEPVRQAATQPAPENPQTGRAARGEVTQCWNMPSAWKPCSARASGRRQSPPQPTRRKPVRQGPSRRGNQSLRPDRGRRGFHHRRHRTGQGVARKGHPRGFSWG